MIERAHVEMPAAEEPPFDGLDLLFALAAAAWPPLAPLALVQYIARRSEAVAQALLSDRPASASTRAIARLLPGARAVLADATPASLARRQTDAPIGQDLVETLALDQIAHADNILIVGPKGSGKTTLLRQLIALRDGAHYALDPHCAPDSWPCVAIGGGRDFAAIDLALQDAYSRLNHRYGALARGVRRAGEFPRHTIVGDEWRAISQELPGERGEKLGAGKILSKILTEGRKVGLCVLAAAHNDTAASMGMAGDMALLTL